MKVPLSQDDDGFGLERYVRIIRVCPDGRSVLSAGWRNLMLWDLSNGQITRTFHGHTQYVMDVRVTPDGKFAVSVGNENAFILWDLNEEQPLRITTPRMHVVEELVSECELHAVSIGANCKQVLCSYDNREAVRESKAQGRSVLVLWNLETGDSISAFPGHAASSNAVSLDESGRYGLSGDALSGAIILWDLTNRRASRNLTAGPVAPYKVSSISSVLLAPNGRHILGSANQVVVWGDLESGEPLHVLRGHSHLVSDVVLTPDSQRAISGSADKTIRIWDLETGKVSHTLRSHSAGVDSLAATTDGQHLLSGSSDGTLIYWELPAGTAPAPESDDAEIETLALSGNSERAVTVQNNTITLWDAVRGHSLRSIELSIDRPRWVYVDEQGRLSDPAATHRIVQMGSEKLTLDIDAKGRRALVGTPHGSLLWVDLESFCVARELRVHPSPVKELRLSRDGQLAFVGFYDSTLKLVKLSDGSNIATLDMGHERLGSLAWADDRHVALTGSESGTITRWDVPGDTRVVVLEHSVDEAKRRAFFHIQGSGQAVTSLDCTADGQWAVAVFADNEPICLDLISGVRRRLIGHTELVTDARFSPTGRWLVTGSADGSLILWDAGQGLPRGRIFVGAGVAAVAVSDRLVVIADRVGRAHFLRIRDQIS